MPHFVTTIWNNMYDNTYITRPQDVHINTKRIHPLSPVGCRIEAWRHEINMSPGTFLYHTNMYLPKDERITVEDYWFFIHGELRLTKSQIHAIAKLLGISVRNMVSCMPHEIKHPNYAAQTTAAKKMSITQQRLKHRQKKRAQRKKRKAVQTKEKTECQHPIRIKSEISPLV